MTALLAQTFYILVGTLFVLTLVVFVHEAGHFLVARWCGVRVDAFSIGFGRELAGFTDRRGTRWRLSAIPLGGYVKFAGDQNAASFPDPEALAAVPMRERAGLFHFAPLWQRAAIVAAGPIANFILAVAIFAVIFATFGRPVSAPVIDSVVAGSAAEKAGLRPGDRIVEIDGAPIESFDEVQRIVTLAAGNELQIVVERGGGRRTLMAVPERREMPDGLGGTQRVGVLGVSRSLQSGDVVFERFSPLEAVAEGVRETGMIVERTLTYVGRLFVGRETADQLSGPLKVAQVSGIVASSLGLLGLLNLSAVLSVSIGLLNLFPVPVLDGGHLVFYAIEALRGRPLSAKAQSIAFQIGFTLIIMLFIFVTYNDLV
jgi:regulator of sigma E protease